MSPAARSLSPEASLLFRLASGLEAAPAAAGDRLGRGCWAAQLQVLAVLVVESCGG